MTDAAGVLAGQVAVVTGASGEIGGAIARGLAEAGMSVALIGRNRTRLDANLRTVVSNGGRAEALTIDITDREAVEAATSSVSRDLGPVSLLVNAAGRIERSEVPIWDNDATEWWSVMTANVLGPFLMIRALVPGMVRRGGGRVVDLSSGFALRDGAPYSAYSASKAALARMGGALAAAGAEHGIRAFEVAPGAVRSPMTAGMPMHRDRPDDEWTPVERTVELVLAIAAGQLDDLSGRYLRAGVDDVDSLRAWSDWIAEKDARTLRLRPWGSDDPVS